MNEHKIQPFLYHSIEEKSKSIQEVCSLPDEEAFNRALDLIDFYASLCSLNDDIDMSDNDGIDWIELKKTND